MTKTLKNKQLIGCEVQLYVNKMAYKPSI